MHLILCCVLLQNEVLQSPIRIKVISVAIRQFGCHPWQSSAPLYKVLHDYRGKVPEGLYIDQSVTRQYNYLRNIKQRSCYASACKDVPSRASLPYRSIRVEGVCPMVILFFPGPLYLVPVLILTNKGKSKNYFRVITLTPNIHTFHQSIMALLLAD